MGKSIAIGLAEEEQMLEVCSIIREGYVPEFLRGTIYESERFDSYLAERRRSGDLFLLAADTEHAESTLGFAQVLQAESALHLNHLVVRPMARGWGIGAALLEDVIWRAQKQGFSVTLDVDSRNTGAIRFYEKTGFKILIRTPVTVISHGSGPMPEDLLRNRKKYEKYGFCYIDHWFDTNQVKIGIIGCRTIRVFARDISENFDWEKFIAWAQWADVFVFGAVDLDPSVHVYEEWSILRMKN